MKTAYFDCFSGISGDMILGALVDLGADFDGLREALGTLPIEGFRLERREVRRCGIGATKIDVLIDGGTEHFHRDGSGHGHGHGQVEDHGHGGEHGLRHTHEAEHHGHDHGPGGHVHDVEESEGGGGEGVAESSASAAGSAPPLEPAGHDQGHRSYAEIETILAESGLSAGVKEKAARAYRLIAEAEAHVHRCPVDNIHFHEVGSIDAIVDVTGAFIAMEMLGIEEIVASEVTTGFGTVKTAHGVMPVPAPATAEILAGVPLRRGVIESELVTPTGAAVLRAVCNRFGSWPEGFHVDRIGYGAGTKEFPGQMNCLRVYLGHRRFAGGRDRGAVSVMAPGQRTAGVGAESSSAAPSAPATPSFQAQILCVVQTEIDDMSGEVYSHLLNRLFELGSHDVTFTPIQMKKNRPAVRVEVLCGPGRRDAITNCLLRETTTFGVKIREVERVCLDRRFETVQTEFGPVRVKVGFLGDEVVKFAPEYEDCHQLAVDHEVALLTVMEAARRAFEKRNAK